jgi:hypothetical protein
VPHDLFADPFRQPPVSSPGRDRRNAVTESEWLACNDPKPLLGFLDRTDPANRRPLRLFACACVRRVAALLRDPRSRQAVEVAERFAEGVASTAALRAAAEDAGDAVPLAYECGGAGWNVSSWYAARAANFLSTAPNHAVDVAWAAAAAAATEGLDWDDPAWDDALRAAWAAVYDPLEGDDWDEVRGSDAVWEMGYDSFTVFPGWATERAVQAGLVREVFGPLPFRPVSVPANVRSWRGGVVIRLARAVYAERAFDRLPVLADALEEAGCTDIDLLGHLRGPGPHLRGCWAVDFLTSRE